MSDVHFNVTPRRPERRFRRERNNWTRHLHRWDISSCPPPPPVCAIFRDLKNWLAAICILRFWRGITHSRTKAKHSVTIHPFSCYTSHHRYYIMLYCNLFQTSEYHIILCIAHAVTNSQPISSRYRSISKTLITIIINYLYFSTYYFIRFLYVKRITHVYISFFFFLFVKWQLKFLVHNFTIQNFWHVQCWINCLDF